MTHVRNIHNVVPQSMVDPVRKALQGCQKCRVQAIRGLFLVNFCPDHQDVRERVMHGEQP